MQTENAVRVAAIVPPRMLTIRQTAQAGPLSEYSLRLMLRQGRLPGVYVGAGARKYLVNYDKFVAQLNGEA